LKIWKEQPQANITTKEQKNNCISIAFRIELYL